jgi:hypothetical protein
MDDGANSLSTMFCSRTSSRAVPLVEETRQASPKHIISRSDTKTKPTSLAVASTIGATRPRRRSSGSRKAKPRLLGGMVFTFSHALAQKDKDHLEKTIPTYGGSIANSAAADHCAEQHYTICPHVVSQNTFSLPASARSGVGESSQVTRQWIDACCVPGTKVGRLPKPVECPSYSPLPFRFPLASAATCRVCISGFVQPARRRVIKLLELLGAKVDEKLSKREATMLVCHDSQRTATSKEVKKLTSARSWGLPIVTEAWLCDCARRGRLENPPTGTDMLASASDLLQSSTAPSHTSDQPISSKVAKLPKADIEYSRPLGLASPLRPSSELPQGRNIRSSQPLPLHHVTAPVTSVSNLTVPSADAPYSSIGANIDLPRRGGADARSDNSTTANEEEGQPCQDDTHSTSKVVPETSRSDATTKGKENMAADSGCPSAAATTAADELADKSDVGRQQHAQPDLKNLVKDFRSKFKRKPDEASREELAAELVGPMVVSNTRRATRSEVECDTTNRPGGALGRAAKARRFGSSSDMDVAIAKKVKAQLIAAGAVDDSAGSTLDTAARYMPHRGTIC